MSDTQRIYLLQCEAVWRGSWETMAAFATSEAAEAAKERADRTDAVIRRQYRVVEAWLYETASEWWGAE